MFMGLLSSSTLAGIALLSALLIFLLSPRLALSFDRMGNRGSAYVAEKFTRRLWTRWLGLFTCQLLVALLLYIGLHFLGVITLELPLLIGGILLAALMLSCLLSWFI